LLRKNCAWDTEAPEPMSSTTVPATTRTSLPARAKKGLVVIERLPRNQLRSGIYVTYFDRNGFCHYRNFNDFAGCKGPPMALTKNSLKTGTLTAIFATRDK
jgi:hypothetical protein